MRRAALGIAVILAAHPAMAWAQQAPAAADAGQQSGAAASDDATDTYADPADIVVTGRKPPGQVVGDVQPELQLGPADVRAYGVDSVADLIDELAPETQSARGSGPPAVLLNGKRISNFHEIRDLPTEAILRVDILPEQVALEYGFSADQKVVNIVLRNHFRSTTITASDKQATEGGSNAPHAELGLVNITPSGRFNLNFDYKQASKLLESERDIIQAPLDDGSRAPADAGRYRTLQPATREYSTNGVYARTIFGSVGATINGRIDYSDSTDDLGLAQGAAAGDAPLHQASQDLAAHLGTTFTGQVDKWNWTVTSNYDRDDNKSFTDRSGIEPGSRQTNFAHSISNTAELNALVTGSPFSLPAGKVQTSWHTGVSTSDFTSHSVRGGLGQDGKVSRDLVEGRFNVDLPIASRARAVLSPLGDLSANFNVAAHQLSDFGTLTRLGYGINWAPIDPLRAVVSWTDKHDAPTAQQLGNPIISTPGRRVFDYITGETVDVTRISGGNPNLAADTQHVFEAEVNYQPLKSTDLRLIATYTAKRTDDAIENLPAPTAAIEAAFPDRFVRDGAGQLVSTDGRPVNFSEESEKTFRWGFNFTAPLKSKIQKEFEAYRAGKGDNPLAGLRRQWRHGGRSGDQQQGTPPANGADQKADTGNDTKTSSAQAADNGGNDNGGGDDGHHGYRSGGGHHGGFGGFGGGRGGGGSGRIQVAVYHTWKLEDTVHIRDGLPALDLLNGDTLGSGGGVSRHQVQGQLGYFNNGLGAQLRLNWQSGTQVNGGTTGSDDPLNFSPLTTLNLRLFADLSSQLKFVAKHPWARGMRVSLYANNLLDSRQRVRDANGNTPISYQPDYLDPLGRTVMISIRKLFYQRSER
ncbi:MAG: TonB-dependent receptor [Sphingomonas sp.]